MSCCNRSEKGNKAEEKAFAGETAPVLPDPDSQVRYKHRNVTEEAELLKRLNRIEGQVRGIKSMVEGERYCVDILTQVSAVQAALNSFSRLLLSNHIKTCVVEEIQTGHTEEAVEELCKTIQKLMR